MKVTHLKSNFASGYVSPIALGHVELDRYTNGVQDIQNMINLPLGSLERRPGTRFVAEAIGSTSRFIPFEFSIDQAYILEFGDEVLRFFTDQGQIVSSAEITNGSFTAGITGWTDASTGTGTLTWNSTNKRLTLDSGGAGTAKAYQTVTSTGTGTHTVKLDVYASSGAGINYKIGTSVGASDLATGSLSVGINQEITFVPATDPDTIYIQFEAPANEVKEVTNISVSAPFEIATPYTAAQVADLKYAQSFDELYICHPDVSPRILQRLGASSWQFVTYDNEDGPYLDQQESYPGTHHFAITWTPSATSGSITITASSSMFVSTDVGRQFRFRDTSSSAFGWGTITGYTSGTVVSATVESTLSGTTASDEWFMGAWGGRMGYPVLPVFHEQRLFFCSSEIMPQNVWFSRGGGFTDMSPDNDENKGQVDDITAASLTIASVKASNMYAAVSTTKDLKIFSYDNIFSITTPNGEGLSPFNVTVKSIISELSSATVRPLFLQNAIIFTDYYNKKVKELGYFFEDDSYRTIDLAIMCEGMFGSPIKKMAMQQEPYSIIWFITEAGDLFSCTYLRAEKIVAFNKHQLGGTDVVVNDIASMPGNEYYEVWVNVSRTINGSTVNTVEFLTSFFNHTGVAKEYANYLDCSLTYEGSAATVISGLEHLFGETVHVVADGAYLGTQTVGSSLIDNEYVDGTITLDEAATVVHIGLHSEAYLVPVPIVLQTGAGSSLQKQQSIYRVAVQFYRTNYAKVGRDLDNLVEVSFRTVNDEVGDSPPLFTGTKFIDFLDFQEPESYPMIYTDEPSPMTVLAITSFLQVSE